MFSAHDIVPYLARRKFLRLDAVVRGDLEVSDASRRNRNLKILSRTGRSYFVKQAVDPGTKASVAREAGLYDFLSGCTGCERLRKNIPGYYLYDRREHLLVLELHPGSRSLSEHYQRTRLCSTLLASQMGKVLAELHGVTGSAAERLVSSSRFHTDAPWVSSLCQPASPLLSQISAANLRLLKIIQKFPEFGKSLERLRLQWRKDRLIHFDIKADNWLVLRPSRPWRFTRLNLVDWEFAGAGDACWDIGSVFADYLTQWLLSIPITGAHPDKLLDLADFPLEKIQPALRAFWGTYVRRMALQESANEWLLRSVEYAAVRLIQRSYEQMAASLELSPAVICFLQVSQNMLRRPEEAAVQLLTLPLQLR